MRSGSRKVPAGARRGRGASTGEEERAVPGGGAASPAGAEKSPSAPDGTQGSAESATAWNPRIVVFACNWCSYAGADTAGVSRIQHQPHFRMIRVMCSGRIQPGFVLHAFEKGADGVLVSGCHFGDCHYMFGNERAVEQFEITRQVVEILGLEAKRLRLEWISAAEGARFAEVINEFTEDVRKLGPSRLSAGRGEPAVVESGESGGTAARGEK
jgi:F420-non-reducing hydrogenase iron-sulfur subunit